MLDDVDKESPAPNPDRVYRNYLETFRRIGIKPVPRDRAKGLIKEWTDAIAAGRSNLPTTH